MPKVLGLQGPPRSGKDTFCGLVDEYSFANWDVESMSHPLAAAAEGILPPETNLEQMKDVPLGVLGYKRPRDFMIAHSEHMKLCYGNDILGHLLLQRTQGRDCLVVNAGFPEEWYPLQKAGYEIRFVRLTRKGHDFSNDSRSYFDFHGCPADWIENIEGDIEAMFDAIPNSLREWLCLP